MNRARSGGGMCEESSVATGGEKRGERGGTTSNDR